jgi:hypothetical protein
MTAPAKDELRKIGELALDRITLTPEQVLVVKAVLAEIGSGEKNQ